MPKGKAYGYDGATKGTFSLGSEAKMPTHVPVPTDPKKTKALIDKMPANYNSGVGRLQAYKKGKRG